MSEKNLNSIVKTYNGYDFDKDGVMEIEFLKLLSIENSSELVDATKKLVIVLIESRLLREVPGIRYTHTNNDFLQRLLLMKQDLLNEGFESKFLELQVMQPKPVSIGTTFSWVNFQLPTPLPVTAGMIYGLAIMGDVPVNVKEVSGTGQRDHNAVSSYEKGFANSFGNIWGTNNNGAMSIYAAGTTSSIPTPSPTPPVYIFGNATVGTISDQNDDNAQSVSYFKCTTSGLVTNIFAHISGVKTGNCVAAIYDIRGNSAGALLQQSSPVYSGGKTLLAIREFFKSIRNTYANFEGVLLIGSFPDAKITYLWPAHVKPETPGTGIEYYKEGGFLVSGARYDIVLADLDGFWSDIYQESVFLHQHQFEIANTTTVTASPDNSKVILTNPKIVLDKDAVPGPVTLKDTFFIQDTDWKQTTLPDGTVKIEFSLFAMDPEVNQKNKNLPNHIATPNICVSRINARNIAVQPPRDAAALDGNGKPQPAAFNFSPEQWERDPNLERTLLIDYFDRNHEFRNGKFSRDPVNVSLLESMGFDAGPADQGLAGWNYPTPRYEVKNATLLDFVRWLKHPAKFRVITTHSDSTFTELRQNNPNALTDVPLVEIECGGNPWCWISDNGQIAPSFKGETNASFYVLRTLWENKQLASLSPSLLIHCGCRVNVSQNSHIKPHYDKTVGTFQNAESLLFYANQLSILCRVTDWNTGPRGFGDKFGSSPTVTFGEGWKGFFEEWSSIAGMGEWDRKRCYEWSIVGDWTLRKDYMNAVNAALIGPPVRDQESNPIWKGGAVNIEPVNHVTQTFIPTLPNLVAVEVGLRTGNTGRGGDNVTLRIHDAQGKELRSITVYVSEGFEGFLPFNILPAIEVKIGQPLDIELNDTGKNVFHWKYAGENPYSRGHAMFYGKVFDTNDFYFRTYGISVNPPKSYCSITAKHSGRCLDVSGVEMGNGANVQQWDWWAGDNQKWKIELVGDGYFKITAKHSGKCLDVAMAGMGNGFNVYQWDWLAGDNQKWKFILV